MIAKLKKNWKVIAFAVVALVLFWWWYKKKQAAGLAGLTVTAGYPTTDNATPHFTWSELGVDANTDQNFNSICLGWARLAEVVRAKYDSDPILCKPVMPGANTLQFQGDVGSPDPTISLTGTDANLIYACRSLPTLAGANLPDLAKFWKEVCGMASAQNGVMFNSAANTVTIAIEGAALLKVAALPANG